MPHGKPMCTRGLAMLLAWLALVSVSVSVLAIMPARAQDVRVARIGFAARLTDPLAQSAQQGATLAIEQANAQPVRTGDGWRFELLAQDDRSDANFAGNVANYFIKSGVVGVIGHWSSDSVQAVAPLYEKAAIPQLNFTSTNSRVTQQGYRQLFRVVGGSDDVAATLAEAALDTLGGRRIVIIGNSSSYSRALSAAFSSQMVKRSGQVAPSVIVSRNTADFNAALKTALAQEADLIVFSAQFSQARNFLESATRLGVKAGILMAGGASNIDFSRDDNGRLYVLEYGIPQDNCARTKTFEQRFRSRFGTPPSTFARYTYDATSMLVQAIRQSDSTDGQKIAAALRDMHYAGLGGEIAFDDAGQMVQPTFVLYHAQQHQWRTLRYFPSDARPATKCPPG